MVAHNVTVEDSSPLIIFGPGWTDSPYGAPDFASYSGYSTPDFSSSHQTNGSASFDFAFNGTAIFVYGTQRTDGGPFSVTLTDTDGSGASTNTVDSSSGTNKASATAYQALLYSHTGLAGDRPHNLHLANGGQGQFDLDFLVVQTELGGQAVHNVTLDDTSVAWSFTGPAPWNRTLTSQDNNIVSKYFQNGSEHTSARVGAQAALKFRGSGVEIHGTWFLGNVSVQLDDLPATIVQSHVNMTAGMYNRPRELIWMADGLTEGNHAVQLTNLGWNGAETWSEFSIDYAVVSTTDASNTDGLVSSTTSSGKTNFGHSTSLLPYNLGLLVLFFWAVSRMRLL